MQYLQIQNINSNELRQLVFEAVASALKERGSEYPQAQAPIQCDFDKLLTKKEAAAHLKISLPTLSKYIKNGYVKAHTVAGTRMRFRPADLEKALKMLNQSK